MYLLVWSNHFVYISLYSGGVQLCLDQYLFFFFFFVIVGTIPHPSHVLFIYI